MPSPKAVDWSALDVVILSALGESVDRLLTEMARQTGVSVVVPEAAQGRTMAVDFNGVPGERAFRSIADALGLALDFDGSVVRFVEPDSAAVFPVLIDPGFFEAEEAAKIVAAMAGAGVEVSVLDGRVVALAPESEHVRLKSVEPVFRAGPDSWAVQVMVFELTAAARESFGIDYSASGAVNLGGSIGAGGLSTLENGVRADGSALLSALFEADADSSNVDLVVSSVLHLVEGSSAKLQRGDVLRIENRVISPEGFITTRDFETIETGLTVEVSGRRVPNGIRLDVRPSISDVVGFLDSAPTVSERSIESTVVLPSGGTAILTGLDSWRSSAERDRTGLPGASKISDDSDLSLLIVIRATRTGRAFVAG